MFSRGGGSPVWAPDSAGEHGGAGCGGISCNRLSLSALEKAPPFPFTTTPAKAGAQLGDVANGRRAPSFQPLQLGPSLRRGGARGRVVFAPAPYDKFARPVGTDQQTSPIKRANRVRSSRLPPHPTPLPPKCNDVPSQTAVPISPPSSRRSRGDGKCTRIDQTGRADSIPGA